MIRRSFHSTAAALKRKSHYDVLNVHRNADKRAIKKSYYRLSKQYHPDLNPNNTEAHAKFLEVNEAYAILGNEASRRQYDSSMDHGDSSTSSYYGSNASSVYNAAFRTAPSQSWHGRARRAKNTGSASARAQAEGMGNKSTFNYREHYAKHYEQEEVRRKQRVYQAAERRRQAGLDEDHDSHRHHHSKIDTVWSRIWRLGVVLIAITYVHQKWKQNTQQDQSQNKIESARR
ncbi:DnaJ domain-containing protein [Phascolomyces articulosus]|uniref:DnaJ domain-containing protein n=1 Tax=Phascolomyces articulosus TaxID=60185 RepID=A0AAD5KQU2_9FUNG|nr:DnaJ domain-containing protein [Phascolomyces articulosus]